MFRPLPPAAIAVRAERRMVWAGLTILDIVTGTQPTTTRLSPTPRCNCSGKPTRALCCCGMSYRPCAAMACPIGLVLLWHVLHWLGRSSAPYVCAAAGSGNPSRPVHPRHKPFLVDTVGPRECVGAALTVAALAIGVGPGSGESRGAATCTSTAKIRRAVAASNG